MTSSKKAFSLLASVCLLGLLGVSQNNSTTNSQPLMRTRRSLQQDNTMDTFADTLPDDTLLALDIPDSAQSLAWDWLSDHPDLATLTTPRMTQLFALATIYFALDGPNWMREPAYGSFDSQWLNYSHPECDWDNQWNERMCDADGQLVVLSLEHLSINNTITTTSPSIPPEIGLLTSLVRVSYQMKMELTIQDLLPTQHYSLPNLQSISLLTYGGTLSPEIGNLASTLKSFSLYHNDLLAATPTYGPLPTELGLCTNLFDLTLHKAAFPGVVPTQLGNLNNLTRLLITGTEMNGDVPSELGQLTDLRSLELQGNMNLGGALPTQLGLLSHLSDIKITNNGNLGGPIPSELVSLTSVRLLDLSDNNFDSNLPSEIGLATSLRRIQLQGNQIQGAIPSQVGQLQKMTSLELQNNQFDGDLPTQVGTMTGLQEFNASFNAIVSLATELGQLGSMLSFDMSHNALVGDLPKEVLDMGPTRGRGPSQGRRSWTLDLSHNQLGGELMVNTTETSWASLVHLNLQENRLQGALPTELGLLSRMDRLLLGGNAFSTRIPTEIGLMEDLEALDLSNLDFLTGPIPSEMGGMTSLIHLDLSNNELTGPIPAELGDLVLTHDLHAMDVTGNAQLRGEVPFGLCELNTNQTYCVFQETCTFDFDCSGQLCGCDCFCTNVNVGRHGGDLSDPDWP